jgi:hypothetical protein
MERMKAAVRGGSGVVEHEVGRAVCGDDADFVRDVEFAENFDRGLHHGVVAAAAHDDADKRVGSGNHKQ